MIAQYQNILNIIKGKRFDQLYPIFKIKMADYSKAYGVPEKNFDIPAAIKKDATSSTKELGEFIPQYAYLQVFGNGKLARLVTWQGDGVIFFNYTNGSGNTTYDITYAKINGKWVIVR